MSFDKEKQRTLKKMVEDDRSDKGSVDWPIKPLLDAINETGDYYTTSSCSGRVILLKIPKNGSKKDAEFLYRTHDRAEPEKVIEVIGKLPGDGIVWFRQEPAIIHVAARTLEAASNMLRLARSIGFKRCGLFEVENRFLMELMSTEKIDTIISRDGDVFVDDKYVKILVEEGNKRLERTWEKTKKFEQEIVTILK